MSEIIPFTAKSKTTPAGEIANSIVRRDTAIEQVRALIAKILVAEGEACRLAMDLGGYLDVLKNSVGHGRWLPFLQDCGIRPRSAQNYMLLAANRGMLEAANTNRSAHLSIAEALRLIRPKKAKPEPANDAAITVSASTTTTIITTDMVIAWLRTATPEEKRKVAATLARDVMTMKKLLPAKTVPRDASPEQIFAKAMALLAPPADTPTAH